MSTVLSIFGTRAEAIKLAPVIKAIEQDNALNSVVCVTARAWEITDQVLKLFAIKPDYTLNLTNEKLEPGEPNRQEKAKLGEILNRVNPDLILLQADTTSATVASLAAHHRTIPVAYVEAGLQPGNMPAAQADITEYKGNDTVRELYCAPSPLCRHNLLDNNAPGRRIEVTGSTLIDSLLIAAQRVDEDDNLKQVLDHQIPFLPPTKKLILVTCHSRENFGEGFQGICKALTQLADNPNLLIVYPVHLAANLQDTVYQTLEWHDNIYLIEPLDYLPFVHLMTRAHIILTDSNEILQAAPSLDKPVLLICEHTNRPEAMQAGSVRRVGTNSKKIVDEVNQLLNSPQDYQAMVNTPNPYGDGRAAERIVNLIKG